MQPKKQLKVQNIGIFEEIDFLLTKNALLKRGPKNSGMGRPHPPYSGNARKKTFFSIEAFPNIICFIAFLDVFSKKMVTKKQTKKFRSPPSHI